MRLSFETSQEPEYIHLTEASAVEIGQVTEHAIKQLSKNVDYAKHKVRPRTSRYPPVINYPAQRVKVFQKLDKPTYIEVPGMDDLLGIYALRTTRDLMPLPESLLNFYRLPRPDTAREVDMLVIRRLPEAAITAVKNSSIGRLAITSAGKADAHSMSSDSAFSFTNKDEYVPQELAAAGLVVDVLNTKYNLDIDNSGLAELHGKWVESYPEAVSTYIPGTPIWSALV
jgi:hypothetical protein